MSSHERARSTRPALVTLAATAVAVAVAVGLLGNQPSAASAGSAPGAPPQVTVAQDGPAPPPPDADVGGLGADGSVPDGVTVFDDDVPAVSHLDASLLDALRRAASDAAGEGVAFVVNSGWRSAEYQEQLRRDAVAEYGSEQEAARWVATAATSPHVQGDAVDVGPWAATAWLSEHGTAYGLCQVYANEPWHYELRPDAVDRGCPDLYADPTHDPRMQP